jgi:hypothetical protein
MRVLCEVFASVIKNLSVLATDLPNTASIVTQAI